MQPPNLADEINKKRACAGRGRFYCIGCLTVLIILTIVIMVPVFRSARLKAEDIACQSNLKALGLATLMYANDNDQRLPPTDNWADNVTGYLGKVPYHASPVQSYFHCPAASSPFSYSMNDVLGSAKETDVVNPSRTAMLFEADTTNINAHGGLADADLTRHHGIAYLCFADGYVNRVNHEVLYERDPYGHPYFPWRLDGK